MAVGALDWGEGGQCGPLAEQLKVVMLQFPPGGRGELFVAGRYCVTYPNGPEIFVGRSLGDCVSPWLPTVLSFYTKSLPWKVFTTSKFSRSFLLRRLFSDSSFLKSE